jgi:hypothetical protein
MSFRNLAAAAAAAATLAAAMPAWAQFAAFVLPARFELKAKAGEKLAEVLEIGNDDAAPQDYRIRTADWSLRPDGAVDFRPDTLDPGSCRPWVSIERHQIKLAGKAKRRYRFEVQVPPNAPEGLCRFALLLDAAEDAGSVSPTGGIQLPIQGRIGVIVYVRVGNVVPDLKLERLDVVNVNGKPTPVAWFRNNGRAHGRPEGTLSGTDAKGRTLDFTVAPLPVLPGEARAVPIWPQDEPDGKPAVVAYPVRLRGTVEWEGGKQPVDASLGAGAR